MNNKDKWNKWYKLASNYYNFYGNLNIKVKFKTLDGINYDESGISLGQWIIRQKNNIDNLTKEQIEKLLSIGMNFNKIKPKHDFNFWYSLASKYYNTYGNLNVNIKFKTLDGINYNETGYGLGKWLQEKRILNNTNLEELKKLENIGFIAGKKANRTSITWDKFFSLARNYYDHYGHLEVSSLFKTLDGINYCENGYKLGYWISNQRRRINILSKDKQDKLKKLNIRINQNYSDIKWHNNYLLLNNYYNTYGDLSMPLNFKTKDGINYDINGFNLDIWYKNQIKNTNLTIEKKELLAKLGANFKEKRTNLKWDEWYELAKNYYNHYGNLEVKRNFTTYDGINFNPKGFKLFDWISKQRKNQNILSDTQIDKLNNIGMRFNFIRKKHKSTKLSWNTWYNIAYNYYSNYNNLKIISTFKTKDGINYDENGYKLGWWIVNQRNNKKLSIDQINKLNNIGMIWSVKKNTRDLIELCNLYNIDININKEILKKSYNEVYSKIQYLQDNNIDIIDSNKNLNQIFFMSDINLESLYNINKQDLIEKYKNNNKIRSKHYE